MPIVTFTTGEFQQPADNPHNSVKSDLIDLSKLLSKYYGKQIRQGNAFTVTAASATLLTSDDDNENDTGGAANVKLAYCPVVKHSRRAWNTMFQQWKKQNRLANRGQIVKYNDFEVGSTNSSTFHDPSRISYIHADGFGDSDAEKVVIWGTSGQGDRYSLESMYTNLIAKDPTTPTNPFGGGSLKQPKFDQQFPEKQVAWLSTTHSANVENVIGAADMLGGGVNQNSLMEFTQPLNVLCGLLEVQTYMVPQDTASQAVEHFTLQISLHVKKWKPLVYRPKSRKRKSSRRKSRGARSFTKSTRWRIK